MRQVENIYILQRLEVTLKELAIAAYLENRPRMVQHGVAGRERALTEFSITTMINVYTHLYELQSARCSRHRNQQAL